MLLRLRMNICSAMAALMLFGVFVRSANAFNLSMTMSAVKGKVEVMRSWDKKWVPAKEGDTVGEGDAVRAGADGECVLRWGKGNLVKVTPYTTFKVDSLRKDLRTGDEESALSTKSGKIDIRAKKLQGAKSTFRVLTPQAVAAVRGTRFSVETAEGMSTRVKCAEGEVEVWGKTGESVVVAAGQLTDVPEGGVPTPPRGMTAEEGAGFEVSGDVSAPELVVTSPAGDLENNIGSALVEGRTTPGAVVTVGGTPATVGASGYFSSWVRLAPGENRIQIAASIGDSRTTAERVVRFVKDETSDEKAGLSILAPKDGYVTKKDFVIVSGTTGGRDPIFVNGTPLQTPEGKKSFNARMNLEEGENKMTITAGVGIRESKATLNVTMDTVAPMLTVWQPLTYFNVDEAGCSWDGDLLICNVKGLTEPGASLTVNRKRCQVEQDGGFNCPTAMPFTQTMITVFSTDEAGNQSSAILTRRIDPSRIAYIKIEVAPDRMQADGQNTAVVTVTALNFLKQPVRSGAVNVTASYGGAVEPEKVTIVDGVGMTVFTAGVGSSLNPVTITGRSGSITGTGIVTLTPHVPPDVPGD